MEWEDKYNVALDDFRIAKGKIRSLTTEKNLAYGERNQLVCALSVLLPAWLERHSEADKDWEDDWRWIVFIDCPSTGQMSWHIHDSELETFDHLERRVDGRDSWDGHTTDEKYVRLAKLCIEIPEQVSDDHIVDSMVPFMDLGWWLKRARFRIGEEDGWTKIVYVTNAEGEMIGNVEDARVIAAYGIDEPELAQPDHSTCSIGYSRINKAWYGWSHRAVSSFKIGHVARDGFGECESGWVDGVDPRTGEPDRIPVAVGFKAETDADCKRMAMAFAASVS